MSEVYTLDRCEDLGRVHGEELAVSVIGSRDWHAELASDAAAARDAFYADLDETEDSFRQYSPFEFHAAAINRRSVGNPDSWSATMGWDRYDTGFRRGVRVALRRAGLGALL